VPKSRELTAVPVPTAGAYSTDPTFFGLGHLSHSTNQHAAFDAVHDLFLITTGRKIMTRIMTLAVMALGLGIALPGSAVAQTAKDLVGTWTMVSNVNIRQDGSRANTFGPHATGIAIFESNGHYAIMNINPDVPKFASNSRAGGTPAENKAAVEGSIGHYGTYSVDTANKVINLKIEGSSYPNWTGAEQKRTIISFAGDDFKWSSPGSIGGTGEVGWKRVK
jgi:hypothetical protein